MKFIYLLFALCIFTACEPNDENLDTLKDELIVGLSYGQCSGDCAFLYLLKDGMIFADDGVDGVGDPASFAFSATPLTNYDELLYDSLLVELPVGLEKFEAVDFGCPDCTDGGTLHLIRVTENGEYSAYSLDHQVENMAGALQPYGRLLQRALLDFRD